MNNSSHWTMNCVLAGCEAALALQKGKDAEVAEKLKNLSSELSAEQVSYLLSRLKELITTELETSIPPGILKAFGETK